jgi:hypothetical protein
LCSGQNPNLCDENAAGGDETNLSGDEIYVDELSASASADPSRFRDRCQIGGSLPAGPSGYFGSSSVIRWLEDAFTMATDPNRPDSKSSRWYVQMSES